MSHDNARFVVPAFMVAHRTPNLQQEIFRASRLAQRQGVVTSAGRKCGRKFLPAEGASVLWEDTAGSASVLWERRFMEKIPATFSHHAR